MYQAYVIWAVFSLPPFRIPPAAFDFSGERPIFAGDFKSESSRNVYGMNHYNVNFSSKLNAGWFDVEAPSNTSAGAIAQVRALYPDASAISFHQLSRSSAQTAANESRRRTDAQKT